MPVGRRPLLAGAAAAALLAAGVGCDAAAQPAAVRLPPAGVGVDYQRAPRGVEVNRMVKVPPAGTYGVIRAQALTPTESRALVEKLLGEG